MAVVEKERSLPPSSTCRTDNSVSSDKPAPSIRLIACYLLVSKAPARNSDARTYIGFTVNPPRRLKQHNGQIRYGGAYRTRKHRPWSNVAVIHGFTCKTQAMQFEWAWQHPQRSLTLKTHLHRPDALQLPTKKRNTVQGALQTLAALVSVPPWSYCPLTLTICAERSNWQRYSIESLVFPPFFRTNFAPLESFERYVDTYDFRHPCDTVTPRSMIDNCQLCRVSLYTPARKLTYCPSCGVMTHLACLAHSRITQPQIQSQATSAEKEPRAQPDKPSSFLPSHVTCNQCNSSIHWSLVVRLAKALESDDD